MIHSRVKYCDPIIPSGQPSGHVARQHAVHGRTVQRLKKRKLSRVRRRGLTEPGQLLDDDMGMAHDVPARVDLYRGRHEGFIGVREPAGFEVIDRDLDGERLALCEGGKVWREDELG